MTPGRFSNIRKSIATKLLMVVFGLYLVIAILVTVGHLVAEYYFQKENITRDFTNIQKSFEGPLAVEMWNLNNETFSSTIVGMQEIPDIVGVKIRNDKDQLIALSGVVSEKGDVGEVGFHAKLTGILPKDCAVHPNEKYEFDVFEHSFPIVYKSKKLGTASIYSSSDIIFGRIKSQVILLFLNAFIKTAALWVIFLWCSYYILRKPLFKLASETEQISLDNLKDIKLDAGIKEQNELKVLEQSINTMTGNLHQSITEKEDAEKAQRESDRKFKGIFNQTFQMMAVLDADGKLLEINDTAIKAHAADKDKVIGQIFWEGPWCRTPALKKLIKEAVKKAAKGELVQLEIEECPPDGSVRYTDFSLKPVFDDDGKVVMLLPEGHDITALKAAFQALEESENNLDITLESIGDAVISTDAAGVVTRINHVATELTGWKAKEAIGKKLNEVFEIIDSNTGDKTEDPVSKVLKKGKIISLANDTVLVAKDKTKRQIADSGAPIRNEEGEIVGVVLVFRDVTDDYKLQEQLRHSQKMEAIGQLAGGVAHDFNNLLTAIMGNAQLIAMSADAESEEAELVSDILKASKRASDLTSQLLAFSRKGPLQNVKLSIHEILDEMIGILSHSIDKRITIIREFNADPDMVVGDPSQLQNAFLNLGVNARDAMPDGGDLTFETANIKISKKTKGLVSQKILPGEYIQINVTDTGLGMDKALIQRIFEPFFSTKNPGQGTGLGLASVYGCVVSHDGDIKVSSKPGKGSIFTILLPVKNSHAEKGPNRKGQVVAGQGNILVIDDEDFVRTLCLKSLTGLGYNVKTVADGMEGLDYYRKHADKVDLVILDLIMPNISGEDTFTLLKEVDPKVKIMILSGFSKDKTVHQLIKNGAMAFVPKPFEIATLSQEIARCLGLS